MIIAGTGHRIPRLGLTYCRSDRNKLRDFACTCLLGADISTIVSGMATGWDTALAEAGVNLGISVLAAVPFEGQEKKWPAAAQRSYKELLTRCREVVIVSPGNYSPEKFWLRDKFMVDKADLVLALWDGVKKGGTYNTVRYANEIGKEVKNVWEEWRAFAS